MPDDEIREVRPEPMSLKDLVLSGVSLVLSVLGVVLAIWFASSAKRDAERAQGVLDQVGQAVKGWQDQVMASTVGILDSLPQVIEGKATLARLQAIQQLTEGIQGAIHEMAKNPQPGSYGHTQEQMLKTLVENLHKLLDRMSNERAG
jgi:hypothetical protein